MRILLVEDEAPLRETLAARLKREGFAVDAAQDGEEGLYMGREVPFDVGIIDLGLPKMSGMELIKALRDEGKKFPVLILTARSSWQDKVEGLKQGADDYLVKPFALDEFEARVRAQLRRVTSNGNPDLRIGRLRIDLAGHRVWIDDQSLELTAREFGLLSALAVRAERIVSRAQLVEALCDWGQDLTDNGLDIALHRLRRKLQPGGMGIRTVRGLGYMLEDAQDDSAP